MKLFLLVLLVVGKTETYLFPSASLKGSENIRKTRFALKLFKKYCCLNKKHYNTPDEHNYRLNLFLENLNNISNNKSLEELEKEISFQNGKIILKDKENSFRMSFNKFFDMSVDEFAGNYLLGKEFFDEKVYHPRSTIVEKTKNGETVVEITEEVDPFDEILRFEQKIGKTKHNTRDLLQDGKKKAELIDAQLQAVKDIRKTYRIGRRKIEENRKSKDFPKFKKKKISRKKLKRIMRKYMKGKERNERLLQRLSRPLQLKLRRFKNYTKIDNIKIPTSLNWNSLARLTPVKNQGPCNSCYAFSAIAALEAHNTIRHSSSTTFAEQEILDCSQRNKHCVGGQPFLVFDYITHNGIAHDTNYPYKAKKGSCRRSSSNRNRNKSRKRFFDLKGHLFIGKGVVNILKALQFGPVVVVLHASEKLKYYYDGLFEGEGCTGKEIVNHSALIYGYELKRKKPFFWVKNVWGEGWGDKGHFKVGIGKLSKKNMGYCGIAETRYNVIPVL